jgi:hypothetical protein
MWISMVPPLDALATLNSTESAPLAKSNPVN